MASYSWRDGFFPGGGFDSLRGDPKQRAVTGNLIPPQAAAGQKGGTSFIRVNSVQEFDQAISVGVDIDVGIGLFGGSAAFDYKNQCKLSTEATFVMVRVAAINPYERLDQPVLTPDALELLENRNPNRFKERFGDKWVSGQTTGVTYFGTVRIEAASRDEQQHIAAQIEASYGFFNRGEARTAVDKSSHSSSSRIEIFVQQNGGEIALCQSVEELFAGARDALQKARDGKAAPFAVQVDDYKELKLPDDDSSALDVEYARRALARYLADLQALETQLNSVRYVLENPHYYVAFDRGPLNEAAAALAEQMNRIKEAADGCSRDANACVVVAPVYPVYTIPARVDGNEAGPRPVPAPEYATPSSDRVGDKALDPAVFDVHAQPALSRGRRGN